MAKKKDAKKEKKPSRSDAVRDAVDQAFQATAREIADAGQVTRGRASEIADELVGVTRGRATEIADELVGNITKLRDVLEDARPATAEEIRALQADVAALAGRLEAVEQAQAAPTKRTAARKAPAKRAAAKPAAEKAAGSKPAAARKPAAKPGCSQAERPRERQPHRRRQAHLGCGPGRQAVLELAQHRRGAPRCARQARLGRRYVSGPSVAPAAS